MDVNFFGMAATFSPFIAAMRQAAGGRLVGIASLAGIRGLPGAEAYSASKAAAISYLESLRLELRDSGVKVVTICPGYIRTPMTEGNPFPMPFLIPADEAARRFARAIARGSSYSVVPWQMASSASCCACCPTPSTIGCLPPRPRKPRRPLPAVRLDPSVGALCRAVTIGPASANRAQRSPVDRLAVAKEAAARTIIGQQRGPDDPLERPPRHCGQHPRPPMSVRHQPGQTELILIGLPSSSLAVRRVSALSAAFDIR
jgi:hypothetical protein